MDVVLGGPGVQKSRGKQEEINFVLEHPSPPEDMPEVVSIWRTSPWKRMKQLYHLHECEVDQGDLGSGKAKPTTLGTNLRLTFPKVEGVVKKRRVIEGRRKRRWFRSPDVCQGGTPIMTSVIAEAILKTEGIAVKIPVMENPCSSESLSLSKKIVKYVRKQLLVDALTYVKNFPRRRQCCLWTLQDRCWWLTMWAERKPSMSWWARLPGLREELEKRLRTKLRKKIQKIKQSWDLKSWKTKKARRMKKESYKRCSRWKKKRTLKERRGGRPLPN